MTTLNVPDMHCAHCVERITKRLAADGIACTVSLDDKTVCLTAAIDRAQEAIRALDDLGFVARVAE